MGTNSENATALYLYAIVMASDAAEMGAIGMDFGGAPGTVYPIVVGEVAAMVSPFKACKRVLPIRKHLDAQNRVLRALNERAGALIPLRFGHVVPDERAIKRRLTEQQQDLVRALTNLRGKTEMALAVSWDVPNIFDHIMKNDPALLALRDQLFAEGREPTRAERLDLGRTFAHRLEEERKTHTERVREALSRHVVAIAEDPVHGEKDVMRLALLIERSQRDVIDELITSVGAEFPDSVLFIYTGPFAPFHFVDLDLDDDDNDGDDASSELAQAEAP